MNEGPVAWRLGQVPFASVHLMVSPTTRGMAGIVAKISQRSCNSLSLLSI